MSIKEEKEKAFREKYILAVSAFSTGAAFSRLALEDMSGGHFNWAKVSLNMSRLHELSESLANQFEDARIAYEEFQWEKQREEAHETSKP